MNQISTVNYVRSRLLNAVRSPSKLFLYSYILLRYPVLYLYYRIYGFRRRTSAQLQQARAQYANAYSAREANPLISIIIPTYNRAQILKDRPLKSILAQTYSNFEVIVVGDGCTDETEQAVASLNDSRIRFFNLQERGTYPENPKHRWYVAGTPALNFGHEVSRGQWIAHLDDDEVFTPDHLEKLLRFAQEGDYEFVYGIVQQEQQPGVWVDIGKTPLVKYLYMNHCGHSTTLWRRYLNLFDYDMQSWRINVPGDQNRWSRLQLADVRIGFLPEVTAIAPLRPGTTLFGHEAEDRE